VVPLGGPILVQMEELKVALSRELRFQGSWSGSVIDEDRSGGKPERRQVPPLSADQPASRGGPRELPGTTVQFESATVTHKGQGSRSSIFQDLLPIWRHRGREGGDHPPR
jgi:hypothetical protein